MRFCQAVAIELWKTKIEFGYFCTNYKLNTKQNEQMKEYFDRKFAAAKRWFSLSLFLSSAPSLFGAAFHIFILFLVEILKRFTLSTEMSKIIIICYYSSTKCTFVFLHAEKWMFVEVKQWHQNECEWTRMNESAGWLIVTLSLCVYAVCRNPSHNEYFN